MAFVRPSYDEILREILDDFRAETGITNFGESSVAGALCRVVAAHMDRLWSTVEEMYLQSNVATATGPMLDRIGQQFGVFRRRATMASSRSGMPVQFTNTGDTAVTIPAGTYVWSSRMPQKRFVTLADVVVPANGHGSVHVQSVGRGSFYNASAGELDRHDYPSESVRVTNPYAIGGGEGEESDDAYRARIYQAFVRNITGTEESIRQAVLELPGIQEVVLYSGRRGPGTLDVVVVPVIAELTPSMREMVESVVADHVAAGISYRVMSAVARYVDVTVSLILQNDTVEEVAPTVRAAVLSVINNLPVEAGNGESTLYLSQLVARIQESTPSIVSSRLKVWVDGIPVAGDSIRANTGERFIARTVVVQ